MIGFFNGWFHWKHLEAGGNGATCLKCWEKKKIFNLEFCTSKIILQKGRQSRDFQVNKSLKTSSIAIEPPLQEMLKPYLETEGTDTEYRLDLQQALNYGTADIWGQIVLCCGGCLVRHPRPLPTRCQEAPPPVVTTGNVSVGMKSAEEKEDVTKGNNGLHVPPPQSMWWNSDSQRGGVGRWGLQVAPSQVGLVSSQQSCLSLLPWELQWEVSLPQPRRALHRTTLPAPWSWTSSLQNVRSKFCSL